MKRIILLLISALFFAGCNKEGGPKLTGEIILSSELFGTEAYYLYGYNFSISDFIKYGSSPSGDALPDIINIPFKNPNGSISAPGFNTPSRTNGFILLGAFPSSSEARDFYENFKEVEANYQYEVDSDTVKVNQVWLQKTQLAEYVKMLVKNISFYDDYIVVSIDFTYQNNGSAIFP